MTLGLMSPVSKVSSRAWPAALPGVGIGLAGGRRDGEQITELVHDVVALDGGDDGVEGGLVVYFARLAGPTAATPAGRACWNWVISVRKLGESGICTLCFSR